MIKLIYGDCLKEMDKLIDEDTKVDAIITDPPYGTTKCIWDYIIHPDDMWQRINLLRKNKKTPAILFGNEPFSSTIRLHNLREYRYDIYWQKERLTNVLQTKKRVGKTVENIMIFYKHQCYYNPQMKKHEGKSVSNKIKNGSLGKLIDSKTKKPYEYKDTGLRYPTDIWCFKRDILTSNIHPTQKPLDLMKELVLTFTKKGDTVLDFTCGSGTTGLACKELNRNFIGIDNGFCNKEGSPFYGRSWIDIAEERIGVNK